MSIRRGPLKPLTPIITDGLIFNLDAASPISYPKSGNTWFDIAGNNMVH